MTHEKFIPDPGDAGDDDEDVTVTHQIDTLCPCHDWAAGLDVKASRSIVVEYCADPHHEGA